MCGLSIVDEKEKHLFKTKLDTSYFSSSLTLFLITHNTTDIYTHPN